MVVQNGWLVNWLLAFLKTFDVDIVFQVQHTQKAIHELWLVMLIKEYSYPNNIIRGRSVICWIMNCWFSIRTKRRLYVPKRENRHKNQEGKRTRNSKHNPLPPTHSNGYSFCVLLTIADLDSKFSASYWTLLTSPTDMTS